MTDVAHASEDDATAESDTEHRHAASSDMAGNSPGVAARPGGSHFRTEITFALVARRLGHGM